MRFTNTHFDLSGREMDLLQNNFFVNQDVVDKTEEFCNGIEMKDDQFDLLLSAGFDSTDIRRTACLLAIIASKCQLCDNLQLNGMSVSIQESNRDGKHCFFFIDGRLMVQISKNFETNGWEVIWMNPFLIGNYKFLDFFLAESSKA